MHGQLENTNIQLCTNMEPTVSRCLLFCLLIVYSKPHCIFCEPRNPLLPIQLLEDFASEFHLPSIVLQTPSFNSIDMLSSTVYYTTSNYISFINNSMGNSLPDTDCVLVILLSVVVSPIEHRLHCSHLLLAQSQKDTIPKKNLRLDSNIYLYHEFEPDSFQIAEMYAFKGIVTIQEIGSWSYDSGLNLWEKQIWIRRKDLMGVTLRSGMKESYANSIVPTTMSNISTWTGPFVQIVNTLENHLNFSVTYAFPSDGVWGDVLLDSGVATGIVKMISEHEVDFSSAELGATASRVKAIRFATALDWQKVSIVSQAQNAGGKVNFMALVHIFKLEVWLVSCGLFLLIAGFMALMQQQQQATTDASNSLSTKNYPLAAFTLFQYILPTNPNIISYIK